MRQFYLFLAAVGSPRELLSGGGGEEVAELEHRTALGLMSLGIPGIAMLLAAFFVGPMPTPEKEGKPRSMPQP